MKTNLKDYYKSILMEGKFDETAKLEFRNDIKNFGRFGEHIYNRRGMAEVSEAVKNLAERASAMALDEAGDWFDAITVKKNMNEVKKDAVLFEKTAKEMGAMQQRLESLYEDMAHKLGRYYEVGDLAGKDVLPADNDYTANGEEEEEKEEGWNENYQYLGDLQGEEMEENFKMDTGKKSGMPVTGNIGTAAAAAAAGPPQQVTPPNDPFQKGMAGPPTNENMAGVSAAPTPGQETMGLGDLMSDDEIRNVKENYWTLQGAQSALMEDEEGVSADEGAPGIAVNKSTEWKARNESRADFFTRMKENLENLK